MNTVRQDEKAPLLQYLDDLSTRERLELLECFVTAFVLRQANAALDTKYAGRTAMKRLGELLARTDADWMNRDVLLNMARTLYFSSEAHFPYYQEQLVSLMIKIAREVDDPKAGDEFATALKRAAEEVSGASFFAAGEVLEANAALVEVASRLVARAINKFGIQHFRRSEIKMISGVITPALAETLGTPGSPSRAELRRALEGTRVGRLRKELRRKP